MLKIFSRKSIIPAVTIGSMLEWYEIGLYIYWASIIERVLFDYALPIGEAINAISAISVGLCKKSRSLAGGTQIAGESSYHKDKIEVRQFR